jgi:hypothetical protein
MSPIRSLRPNVGQAEAVERLGRGVAGLAGWLGRGPLRSVADVYVPFRLYRVELDTGSGPDTTWLAIDAVNGSLDPYQFDHAPDGAELVELTTRNRPEPRLPETDSARLLEDKVRRIVFQTGFFRVRRLRFQSELLPLALHVPYWVGFYGRDGALRLRVLDAVRRCFEGGKARALFHEWLAGRNA